MRPRRHRPTVYVRRLQLRVTAERGIEWRRHEHARSTALLHPIHELGCEAFALVLQSQTRAAQHRAIAIAIARERERERVAVHAQAEWASAAG